jgi:hypothetical protein
LIPILSGSARSGKLFSLPGASNTSNTTNITRPTLYFSNLPVYDLYYIIVICTIPVLVKHFCGTCETRHA